MMFHVATLTGRKRGFTLIELLVVIAIIGILASVVMTSLSTARTRGSNAKVRSELSQARNQAALYFDNNDSVYTNVCGSGGTNDLAQIRASVALQTPTLCADRNTAWALEAQLLETTDYYCVDSLGASGIVAASSILDNNLDPDLGDYICGP